MLTSLTIQGFRCFERLEMPKLGRINVLVGNNNSGKSCLLEAVQLLLRRQDPTVLWDLAKARRELPSRTASRSIEFPVTSLFYGRSPLMGSELQLQANQESGAPLEVCLRLEEDEPDSPMWARRMALAEHFSPNVWQRSSMSDVALSSDEETEPLAALRGPFYRLALKNGTEDVWALPVLYRPLSQEYVLNVNMELSPLALRGRPEYSERMRGVVIPTGGISERQVTEWLGAVTMHKELEAQLIQTLQELEPSLERIGLGGAPSNEGRSTQIFVNLKDTSTRLPLGTLGDGMWRLLGMALAAQNAHNGLLLIDEVDTGLHYRTLEAMWRMLYQRAQTHNIQIIASTHSHDCVRSLSAIVQEGVTEHSQVMVHRLQRGQPQPVSYSEQAILFAAEHDLEVR